MQDAQLDAGNETPHENDVECDFQAYWLGHGEFLVWQAWLEKYSDYVNTDMMDHVAMPVETEVEICTGEEGDDTMGEVMENIETGEYIGLVRWFDRIETWERYYTCTRLNVVVVNYEVR